MSISKSDNLVIVSVAIAISIIMGLVRALYSRIDTYKLSELLRNKRRNMHIKSKKQGIQLKHAVIPTFFKIKNPLQRFIQSETNRTTSHESIVKIVINRPKITIPPDRTISRNSPIRFGESLHRLQSGSISVLQGRQSKDE